MRAQKKRTIGIAVSGALLTAAGVAGGLAFVPTTSSASTTVETSYSRIVEARAIADTSRIVVSNPVAPPAAAPVGGVATEQIGGGVVKAIVKAFIAAVKKVGPALFKAMVKALKAGYGSFVKFLDKVPGWVKAIVSGISTNALYDWLKKILGIN